MPQNQMVAVPPGVKTANICIGTQTKIGKTIEDAIVFVAKQLTFMRNYGML